MWIAIVVLGVMMVGAVVSIRLISFAITRCEDNIARLEDDVVVILTKLDGEDLDS